MAAGDRERFHALDDEFHRRICALAGHEFAWALIRENKAHMDRVRFLSLSFGAQAALDDHVAILDGDPGAATPRRRSRRCGCISAGSRTSWRGSG